MAPPPRRLAPRVPRLIVAMAARPRPPAPGPRPGPKAGQCFFKDVSRRLLHLSKHDLAACEAGLWAERFAAALNRYAVAQTALEALAPAVGGEAATRYAQARARAMAQLDIVLRIKNRMPAVVGETLGHLADDDDADAALPIGVWASLSRALTLSRAILTDPQVLPARLDAPPPSDPLGSLAALRHLLDLVNEARIDMPDVARWSIGMTDAVAAYDAADKALRENGHGPGGRHLLALRSCCQQLLREEALLPYGVQTVTAREGSFEAKQRWIDEAGTYIRGSGDDGGGRLRVQGYLSLRLRDLNRDALPYEATFT